MKKYSGDTINTQTKPSSALASKKAKKIIPPIAKDINPFLFLCVPTAKPTAAGKIKKRENP